ncbi:MAG: D-glycero-alpha-D-manno-heptose-1,7-bisphosphate 7-phosphatase [Flavobacteriales bacterium]
MNKAVFLDRDGVINHDPGDYTKSVEEFTILPNVLEALKKIQDKGYLLILVTNQGGIAKGLYSHKEVAKIHKYLLEECAKHEVKITEIYYSPHHDDFGKSLTRKPGSLMVERGLARFNVDPSRSYLIGDKQRDCDSGEKVGVKGILIPTNAPLMDYVDLLA